MPLDVRSVKQDFGAHVTNVNVSAPLSEAAFAAIHAAWLAHGVLIFRDQHLDDDALVAFSSRFGTLEASPASDSVAAGGSPVLEIWIISNVIEDGKPIGSLGSGEAEWHTDMSYVAKPPKASVLYALSVPDRGGDTWFADMNAAYDTLPDDLRAAIAGRRANHAESFTSVGELRKGAALPSGVLSAPGTAHPIVRTHSETHRRALYLGRRRWAYIEGLEVAESEALLDRLWAHCADAQFAIKHRWRPGDLVVWDNRRVIHRRDAFDSSARRIMHRTQIMGDRPA